MSTQSESKQQQPSLPAKPEARRGVVTNPIVVSNARGERKNQKQPGQNKHPNTAKNNTYSGKKGKTPPADGQPRKPKKPVADSGAQPSPQNSRNGTQSPSNLGSNGQKGKRKNANLQVAGSNQNQKDSSKLDDPRKYYQGSPITNNGDAYSGSSFHSAPAASSLPRPSFGVSPHANAPPPQTWSVVTSPGPGGTSSGFNEMLQMPPVSQIPHMPHMPMPMPGQFPGVMVPPGYPQFGYYPNQGYGVPMGYNGYYYAPPGGVASTPNGQ